jgi:excisionase family DNA binding protein
MPRPPKKPSSERDWLTTPEVAEVFDVGTDTIRQWIKKGYLKTVKINTYHRVTKDEVRRLAKEKFQLEGDW